MNFWLQWNKKIYSGREMMKKVLIVDDDIKIIHFLKGLISHKLNFPSQSAKSLKEAQACLNSGESYAIALVDISLPDAKEGECVDLVISSDIPVIVMCDEQSRSLEKRVFNKDILDYVRKDSANSFDYAMRLLQFVYGFEHSQILLVDDSKTTRLKMKYSLCKLPLVIHEAGDGYEAMDKLQEYPDIQLVITDKSMPNMNGIELIKEIRKRYAMEELAIMGISASEEPMMSVEFLRQGANDFITKPFIPEELFSRVISSLESLYYIQLAKKSAMNDFLTGLQNRRYLYETGLKLYENAKRQQLSIIIAMIDVDHFKKINDRYGHEAGDLALNKLGQLMLKEFRSSDVLTRYGGEEFCIILTNTNLRYAQEVMQRLCEKVEEMLIQTSKISFRMTISIGLTDQLGDSFDQMIASADAKLYQAKQEGRNRVVG